MNRMKKYIALLGMLALVASTGVVFAQNGSSVPATTQTEIDQASARAKVIEDQQVKMGLGLYRGDKVKQEAYMLAQLANVQVRMQSFMDKAKANGIDITAGVAKDAEVTEAMVAARMKLDGLKEAVAESETVSADSQQFFAVITAGLKKDTRMALKTVHQHLIDLMGILKTYRQ